MKKVFVLLLVIVLFVAVAPAQAGKRAPVAPAPAFSWFGNYGGTIYPTLTDGYVYASQMNYSFVEGGYYTISGDAFVGQQPAVTHISGSCFTLQDAAGQQDFSASVYVDGWYELPLFTTTTSWVGVFDVTVKGQSFVIKVNSFRALGCNILLELVK